MSSRLMPSEPVVRGSAAFAAASVRPRKVAIIAGQLVLGGAERQLYLWLSHMDRRRFDPVVVTLHPECGDYWEPRIEGLGIPVLRVARRLGRLGRLARLARTLAHESPELVHGWHLFASPYAALAGKLVGARASLGSLRGSYDHYRRQPLLAAVTPRLVDGLVVNSGSAAARLAEHHPGLRGKIYVVPNAVEPPEALHPSARVLLAERWKIPGERIWIGWAGRLDPGKRLEILLEAGARLRDAGMDVHLVLMGDGPERGSLGTRVAQLRLTDHVTFTGAEPNARSLVGAIDVFCFVSTDEGMPNAVLEAAAAGVPVVAWRTSFLEEALTQGESASLVEPDRLDDLTAELTRLVGDASLRQRLGDGAKRRVLERFSVGRFVDRLTAVYDQLLNLGAADASVS